MPRIGGYVIFGNNADTLGPCLDSLLAVCDRVVAVDSQSTDGSRDLCAQRGIQRENLPWQGYGAARARAVQALDDVDYVFFLDSDETLPHDAVQPFTDWRRSAPTLPHYTLKRHDWVETAKGRFLFRCETRTRLIRRDACTWTPDMIVHEALPKRPSASMGLPIHHRFCTDPADLRSKLQLYALLWAVRFAGTAPPARSARLHGWANLLRNVFVKGALWRGGRVGVDVSRAMADYHALKYTYHARLNDGAHPELQAAFAAGRYGDVFTLARQACV